MRSTIFEKLSYHGKRILTSEKSDVTFYNDAQLLLIEKYSTALFKTWEVFKKDCESFSSCFLQDFLNTHMSAISSCHFKEVEKIVFNALNFIGCKSILEYLVFSER